MDVVSQESNSLSTQRIALQKRFKEYNDTNGFSYEEWINPPAGHFYESYKQELEDINNKMAPPLQYQS